MVFSFWRCGLRLRGGYRSKTGIDSSTASKGAGVADSLACVAEPGFQLTELCLGRVVHRETGSPLDMLDERMEGAVHVVRGALILQQCVRLRFDAFSQSVCESALADTRFPRQEHDLTLGVLGPLPAIEQQETFCLSAYQHGVLRAPGRLESAFARSLAHDPPSLGRLGKPLELRGVPRPRRRTASPSNVECAKR